MSVRGEFRRLANDLLAVHREAGLGSHPSVAALEPLLERAAQDLSGAADGALALVPDLDGRSLGDPDLRRRCQDAQERFEAVCRIILGRSAAEPARRER